MKTYVTATSASVEAAIESYRQRTGARYFRPKAALIDMDGTLLDSMRGHAQCWYRLISEEGIECTPDEFFLYEGMTGAETINLLFKRGLGREATQQERTELYARKAEYFNELPRVPIVKGADRMVKTLIDNNIERVLVTGSGQLSSLERLKHDFPSGFADNMRITSHNVTHCKPHPEPYLKAMELAKVKPWEAIAIENAPLGVKSAADAGAFTVAVTTGPIPAEQMHAAGADMVFPTMDAFADTLPKILNANEL